MISFTSFYCGLPWTWIFPWIAGNLLKWEDQRRPGNEPWGIEDYMTWLWRIFSRFFACEGAGLVVPPPELWWGRIITGVSKVFKVASSVLCAFHIRNSLASQEKPPSHFSSRGLSILLPLSTLAWFARFLLRTISGSLPAMHSLNLWMIYNLTYSLHSRCWVRAEAFFWDSNPFGTWCHGHMVPRESHSLNYSERRRASARLGKLYVY
jgi:hypothetical protein